MCKGPYNEVVSTYWLLRCSLSGPFRLPLQPLVFTFKFNTQIEKRWSRNSQTNYRVFSARVLSCVILHVELVSVLCSLKRTLSRFLDRVHSASQKLQIILWSQWSVIMLVKSYFLRGIEVVWFLSYYWNHFFMLTIKIIKLGPRCWNYPTILVKFGSLLFFYMLNALLSFLFTNYRK